MRKFILSLTKSKFSIFLLLFEHVSKIALVLHLFMAKAFHMTLFRIKNDQDFVKD